MRSLGRLAYANARLRALKAELLGPDAGLAFRAMRPSGLQAAAAAAGLTATSIEEMRALAFARLVRSYVTILRSYPSGDALFRALARLHDVENLKIAWRAVAYHWPLERWLPVWRPLGPLGVLTPEMAAAATTPAAFLRSLEETVYEPLARIGPPRSSEDVTLAELQFDRWALAQLEAAAASLPATETRARGLIARLVIARDLDTVRRAIQSYGMPADVALRWAVRAPAAFGAATVTALATWTPAEGALARRLPPGLAAWPAAIRDWSDLRRALGRDRRRSCEAAFCAWPYQLAPAVALLLLQEAELEGLLALAEWDGRPETASALADVLAASALED